MKKIMKKVLGTILCVGLITVIFPICLSTDVKAEMIAESQTWDGKIISEDTTITGSTDENNPVVITVNGTVTVNNTITTAGYVKFTGSGMLKRGASNLAKNMLQVNGTTTIDGITTDGGSIKKQVIPLILRRIVKQ